MKRCAKLILVAVPALLFGLIVWWMLFADGAGNRQAVENYKHELLSRGEKLAIAEQAPPATNDLARIKAFLELMREDSDLTNHPYAKVSVAPGAAASGLQLLTADQMTNYAENVSRVAKLRTLLGTNRLGFNLDYSPPLGPVFPEYRQLNMASVLVAGTSVQALATNDAAEAQTTVFLAVDLLRFHDDNTDQSSVWQRNMTAKLAMDATWEALQSALWSNAPLSELQAKWEGMNLFESAPQYARMQRAYHLAMLADMRRKDAKTFAEESDEVFMPPRWLLHEGWSGKMHYYLGEPYGRYVKYLNWKKSWSYDEELYLLQVDNAVIKLAESAKKTGALAPAAAEYEKALAGIRTAHPEATNHFISQAFEDQWKEDTIDVAEMEACRTVTVTAIALRRYQLAHGAYPASLAELVPDYLSRVPIDFMDGQPLRYQIRTDSGYLLYSVGDDGKDDGGDPTPTRAMYKSAWWKGRDLVWPRRATQKEIADYQKEQKDEAVQGFSGN